MKAGFIALAALAACAPQQGADMAVGNSAGLDPLYCTDAPRASLPPHATCESGDMPPARYQGDTSANVSFVHDLNESCGVPPEGKHWGGCVRFGILFIANPCPIGPNDDYAKRLCHEIGHRNGWPEYHGD